MQKQLTAIFPRYEVDTYAAQIYACLCTVPEKALRCVMLFLPIHLSSAYVDEQRQTLYPVLDCRKVNLKLRAANQNIFNISMDTAVELDSLPSEACGALVAVAANVGNTKVTISLDTKTFGRLEATVTIAAYPPLKVCVCTLCINFPFVCTLYVH